MQAVHESGHALGALATGGRVSRVVLHPFVVSRTDVSPNPMPLVVAWSGPVVGVSAPLVIWGLAAYFKLRCVPIARFFAGFCLVANGLYLGIGSFSRIGDAGDLLRHGAPYWQLWLFGVVAAPFGFWLWHRQGAPFGFGAAGVNVDRSMTVGALIFALATGILLFVFGHR